MINPKVTDEQFFLLLENELSATETKRLMDLIARYPHLQKEWNNWKQTMQAPEAAIFVDKQSLYAIADHKNKASFWVWYRVPAAAAAVLLFGMLFYWSYKPSSEHKIKDIAAKKEIDTTISAKPPQYAENEKGIENTLSSKSEKNIPLLAIKKKSRVNNNQPQPSQSSLPIAVKENAPIAPAKQLTIDTINGGKQLVQQIKTPKIDTLIPFIGSNSLAKATVTETKTVYGQKVSKKTIAKAYRIKEEVKKEIGAIYDKPALAFGNFIKNKNPIQISDSKITIKIRK